MRHYSKKRQKINRKAAPVREEYRRLFPICQLCCQRPGCDCHEIARGGVRVKAISVRASLLHVCRRCHNTIQNWSTVLQLAIKKVRDPEGYNRSAVLQLMHKADTAITEKEVNDYLAGLEG